MTCTSPTSLPSTFLPLVDEKPVKPIMSLSLVSSGTGAMTVSGRLAFDELASGGDRSLVRGCLEETCRLSFVQELLCVTRLNLNIG